MADRRPVNQLPVYLQPSEVARMVAACENDRDRMLIRFLLATGARVSEAIDTYVGDITNHGVRMPNLKQGYWRKAPATGDVPEHREHVSVRDQKHVFLPRAFLADLKAYCAGKAPQDVIIGRLVDGKPMTRQMAWYIVTTAAKKAGIFRRRFSDGSLKAAWTHSLRHSSAVCLLEAGLPITAVQHQLGHSSLSSTQVYSRLTDARIEELIAEVKF